jgi:hypothetical protein
MSLLEEVCVFDSPTEDKEYMRVRIVFGITLEEAKTLIPCMCKWRPIVAVKDPQAYDKEISKVSFVPIPGSPNFKLKVPHDAEARLMAAWMPGLDALREEDGHLVYEEIIVKTSVTSAIVKELYNISMRRQYAHLGDPDHYVNNLLECLAYHWH